MLRVFVYKEQLTDLVFSKRLLQMLVELLLLHNRELLWNEFIKALGRCNCADCETIKSHKRERMLKRLLFNESRVVVSHVINKGVRLRRK